MIKSKPFSRLNDGSRMSGDVHVRFCEGLGVRFPRATHQLQKMEECFSAESQNILNSAQHLVCKLTSSAVDRDR